MGGLRGPGPGAGLGRERRAWVETEQRWQCESGNVVRVEGEVRDEVMGSGCLGKPFAHPMTHSIRCLAGHLFSGPPPTYLSLSLFNSLIFQPLFLAPFDAPKWLRSCSPANQIQDREFHHSPLPSPPSRVKACFQVPDLCSRAAS